VSNVAHALMRAVSTLMSTPCKSVHHVATAALVCLLVHWPGLTSWFQKDDFAWLGLRLGVHGWRDLAWALLTPLAQGTIRIWSERVFFMAFSGAFGMNALPFHFWAYLTEVANLALLYSIVHKVCGSRAVAFWAAILWVTNTAVASALAWASNYNEILCAFFLLLSFRLLLEYIETGRLRYYVAQTIAFVLGLGALELMVVYPALAAVYALCCARQMVRKLVPLFAISVIFTAVKLYIAPLPVTGPYQLYWDSSLLRTLWTYWKMALGPSRLILVHIHPSFWRSLLAAAFTVALIGFLIGKLRQRQPQAAFFAAWFLIAIAPVLPLREHIIDAYLAIPCIGLAAWGAAAMVSGWHHGIAGKLAAGLLSISYLAVNVPVARVIGWDMHDRTLAIRRFVEGVVALAKSAPGKAILLRGVSPEMFDSAVHHRVFRLYGLDEVSVLTDETEARAAVASGRAVVFDVSGSVPRDITAQYRVVSQFEVHRDPRTSRSFISAIIVALSPSKPGNEFTTPSTVPNNPTHGAVEAMVARESRRFFRSG
jgi:hypothetical protein